VHLSTPFSSRDGDRLLSSSARVWFRAQLPPYYVALVVERRHSIVRVIARTYSANYDWTKPLKKPTGRVRTRRCVRLEIWPFPQWTKSERHNDFDFGKVIHSNGKNDGVLRPSQIGVHEGCNPGFCYGFHFTMKGCKFGDDCPIGHERPSRWWCEHMMQCCDSHPAGLCFFVYLVLDVGYKVSKSIQQGMSAFGKLRPLYSLDSYIPRAVSSDQLGLQPLTLRTQADLRCDGMHR
jgi:hypothetical protein